MKYRNSNFKSNAIAILAFIFYIMILSVISFSAAAEGSDNLTVFSPTSSQPYGMSYAEWTAKWWQWFISIPGDNNHPINDATGASCSRNQAGPWRGERPSDHPWACR